MMAEENSSAIHYFLRLLLFVCCSFRPTLKLTVSSVCCPKPSRTMNRGVLSDRLRYHRVTPASDRSVDPAHIVQRMGSRFTSSVPRRPSLRLCSSGCTRCNSRIVEIPPCQRQADLTLSLGRFLRADATRSAGRISLLTSILALQAQSASAVSKTVQPAAIVLP